MVVRFEVGKIYLAPTTRYAKDGKTLKHVDIEWLCVKRNDATGYVSFTRYDKFGGIGKVESRKVKINTWKSKTPFEEVMIGYGGSGAWRNWYYLSANNVKG